LFLTGEYIWRRQSAGINWKERSHNFALEKSASITFLGERSLCWKKIILFSSIKKYFKSLKYVNHSLKFH